MENIRIIFIAILLSLLCTGLNAQRAYEMDVVVKIDFGGVKEAKKVKVSSDHGLTALEALQYAAEVNTHPKENYVFVDKVDGIKGERGKMGWYYEVNGKSPEKLAIKNELSNGDEVRWIYKEDVCSRKVDK